MCGGGGTTYTMPDPMAQAEADILTLQEEYRLAEQQATAAAEAEAAAEEAARKEFDEVLAGNRATAYGNIQDAFNRAGLDYTTYDDRINAALDLASQGMNYSTGNNTYSSDIGTNLLNDMRNEQIREYEQAINAYAPEGFATTAFTDTADDAIIDAILSEQFGEASDAILRARDRGTLNDQGYDYAMSNLDQQRTAAASRLQDIGGGILGDYRTQLTDLADNARTGASNWDFGDTFDPNYYSTQISDRQASLSSGLEGAIRNAIGGEQFFNTNELLQKGGVGQGATNTGLGSQSGSLLAAIDEQKKNEEQARGLGTQGSF